MFIIGIITTIITEGIASDVDVTGMDVLHSGGDTIDIKERDDRKFITK